MITVRLQGGLGNQLFQAGLAMEIQRRLGVPCRLDPSLLEVMREGVTPRQLEINRYLADLDIATKASQQELPISKWALRISKRSGFCLAGKYIVEKSSNFDPVFWKKIEASKKWPLILEGFWQSHHYVPSADFILKSLRWPQLSKPASAVQNKIEATGSSAISIHVRGGDYLSNPTAARHHGVLDQDYYRRANEIFKNRNIKPTAFIFTDSPEHAARFDWSGWNVAFVSGDLGALSADDELQLMSKCTHHVLANSSFSWWAAYLRTTTDGLSVAPARWVADGSVSRHSICPEHWICL